MWHRSFCTCEISKLFNYCNSEFIADSVKKYLAIRKLIDLYTSILASYYKRISDICQTYLLNTSYFIFEKICVTPHMIFTAPSHKQPHFFTPPHRFGCDVPYGRPQVLIPIHIPKCSSTLKQLRLNSSSSQFLRLTHRSFACHLPVVPYLSP